MPEEYSLRLITEPTAEPVTLVEAKGHLVVEHSNDDTLIGAMITAARKHVEFRTNRALVRQKWRLSVNYFTDPLYLRKTPVLSVDSLNYVDENGANQVVGGAASPNNPSAYYTLDIPNACIRRAYGATYPTARYQANAVWADFWAGYADTTTSPNTRTPADLRAAILLMVSHLYEHRSSNGDVETFSNPAFDLLMQAHWMPV